MRKENYAIFCSEKIKQSGTNNLWGSASHVARTRETPNADPSRRHLNRQLHGFPTIPSPPELAEEIRRRTEGSLARTDAVVAQEIILSASHDYFKTDWDTSRFVTRAASWLKSEFGDYLVSATLHADELTPHIHAYVVVVREGKLKNGRRVRRLSTSQAFTPQSLKQMHTSFAKSVAHLGLVRGRFSSKSWHEHVGIYHARVNEGIRRADELQRIMSRTFEPEKYNYTELPGTYAEGVKDAAKRHYITMAREAKIVAAANVELVAKLTKHESIEAKVVAGAELRISTIQDRLDREMAAIREERERLLAEVATIRSECGSEVERVRQIAGEEARAAVVAEVRELKNKIAELSVSWGRTKQELVSAKQEAAQLGAQLREVTVVQSRIQAEQAAALEQHHATARAKLQKKHKAEIAEAKAERDGLQRELTGERESRRGIPLEAVPPMLGMGDGVAMGPKLRWQNEFADIEIEAGAWRNLRTGATGRSAIEFVNHVCDCEWTEATARLSEYWSAAQVQATAAEWMRTLVTPLLDSPQLLAKMRSSEAADQRVCDYLVAQGFDEAEVKSLMVAGKLLARVQPLKSGRERVWAVFPHQGEGVGYTLQATDRAPGSRLVCGNTASTAVIFGYASSASELAFTDSPIEALAYRHLYPEACVVAGGRGGVVEHSFARHCLQMLPAVSVVWAKTPGGSFGQQEEQANLARISAMVGGRTLVKKEPSVGASWSEMLRAKRDEVRHRSAILANAAATPGRNLAIWRAQQSAYHRVVSAEAVIKIRVHPEPDHGFRM